MSIPSLSKSTFQVLSTSGNMSASASPFPKGEEIQNTKQCNVSDNMEKILYS